MQSAVRYDTYLLLLVRVAFYPFLSFFYSTYSGIHWIHAHMLVCNFSDGSDFFNTYMFLGIKQLHEMRVIWWSLVTSNQASPWSTFQSNWLGSIVITSLWPTLVMDLIFYYILACMYWSAPWAVCDVMEPGRKQPGSITIYIPVKLNNNLSNKMDV